MKEKFREKLDVLNPTEKVEKYCVNNNMYLMSDYMRTHVGSPPFIISIILIILFYHRGYTL